MVAVPLAGRSQIASELAGSVNVVSSDAHTVNVLSSGIVSSSVSITGNTVMITVAVSHNGSGSQIAYVNVSWPTKFSFGVYVIVLSPFTVTVPFEGSSITSGVPNGSSGSESLSSTSIITGVS